MYKKKAETSSSSDSDGDEPENLLKVLPVKKPKDEPTDLNPILLPHAFLLMIVAPPRAGKSNLIMNLICNSEFYRGKKKDHYFQEIYYCSPTQEFDKTTMTALKLLDNVVQISDMDQLAHADVILRQLQAEQRAVEKEDRKKILVVFDDMVGLMRRNSEIATLSTKYRHYDLSIIVVAQSYRALPPLIRNCATGLVVFGLANGKEFEKIYEEIGSGFPEFETMFNYATQKRYEFCYMNIEGQQVYRNFEELLFCKDRDTAT